MDTLGKRIVHYRKGLKLTQEQLAEKLGVTAQAVSKWENDQSCPDIAMLPLLADIFGISTDTLLGREAPAHEGEVVACEPEEKENKFEFHWDGGRKYGVMFAFMVLAVGGLFLLNQLLSWGMSFWEVLWPTCVFVYGVFHLWPKFSFVSTGCVLLGGYFLVHRWLPLPENLDSGVIWAGVIVLFGISLLVDALRKPRKPKYWAHYNGKKGKETRKLVVEDGEFSYDASFSSDSVLISVDKLEGGEANCAFGEYTLDLTGVQSLSSDCHVEINCSFGEVTILVPRRYMVAMEESCAFASIKTAGEPDADPHGHIHMECNCSFGELEIQYV